MSTKITYNSKDLNTWECKSNKTGKPFYSITLPEQFQNERFPNRDLKISFIISPKFLFDNSQYSKVYDKAMFIVPEHDFKLNIYDYDLEKAIEKPLKGKDIIQIIKDYVPKSKIIDNYKSKQEIEQAEKSNHTIDDLEKQASNLKIVD